MYHTEIRTLTENTDLDQETDFRVTGKFLEILFEITLTWEEGCFVQII